VAGKVRTWVWIVVAIVVLGILAIVALAGVSIYYFSQHIDTKPTTPAAAAQEFEQIKGRFSGQAALIELDDAGRLVRSNTNRPAPANPKKPDELHVLAFDPDSDRIVSVTVPFWLLRLKLRGTKIQLGDGNMDLEDLKLSVEDLERYGPTLIVDHKARDGERVLVWSQ
jgi:hypothetical protein